MPIVTLAERRERRRRVVADIRAGTPMAEAARRSGLSLATVYRACAEAGVERPGNRAQFSSYAVLAALFDPGRGLRRIARDHGLSTTRVQDMYREARAAGIPLPERHATGTRPAREESA
jgi:transposase-like protein